MKVGGKVIAAPPSIKPPAAAADVRPNDPAVIEPTKEEARNGWTREALTTYMIERASQQQQFATEMAGKNRPVRSETTAGFDPHRWGR